MVIEKVGYKITGHVIIALSDAKKTVETLASQNTERRRLNKSIATQLRKLERELGAKKRALAGCDDTARKVKLEEEIAALGQEVDGKKAARQPIIAVFGPKRFAKEVQAKAFVEQVARQVERAKAKADAKKAAAEAKKAAAEAKKAAAEAEET